MQLQIKPTSEGYLGFGSLIAVFSISTHDLSTSANSEKDSSGIDAAGYDQPFNYHNSMD